MLIESRICLHGEKEGVLCVPLLSVSSEAHSMIPRRILDELLSLSDVQSQWGELTLLTARWT